MNTCLSFVEQWTLKPTWWDGVGWGICDQCKVGTDKVWTYRKKMYWNMYSTPINFRLSRSIFQIEANKTIPCLIMFMAMVCRDGSIHPRCHGGRCYVERWDYWKQRISPGATSDPVWKYESESMKVKVKVWMWKWIIGSSVSDPGQQVTQSLKGGEAVQGAMIWDKFWSYVNCGYLGYSSALFHTSDF